MAWEPLLEGRAAARIERTVREIAGSIEHLETNPIDWGPALLHSYLACAGASGHHKVRAHALLDAAVDRLAEADMRPMLYGGFTGVGWLVAHTDRLFQREEEDAFEEIDHAVLRACEPINQQPVYDLITGYVGFGVYFLERLPRPRATQGLESVVTALEALAERSGDLATWHTPAGFIPPQQRRAAPDGYYNLGVAHGVPGVVSLLSAILRTPAGSARVERLLRASSAWILAQRPPTGSFPTWVGGAAYAGPSRLAWCYGDLGIATSLLNAAIALEDDSLHAAAVSLGLEASGRRHDASVVDASLCHGSAGNAHLFNCLFQATQRAEFRDAAISWLESTLTMRRANEGLAGFLTSRPTYDEGGQVRETWQADASFLTGVSGTALALLAAITPLEPHWDRVLLARL